MTWTTSEAALAAARDWWPSVVRRRLRDGPVAPGRCDDRLVVRDGHVDPDGVAVVDAGRLRATSRHGVPPPLDDELTALY